MQIKNVNFDCGSYVRYDMTNRLYLAVDRLAKTVSNELLEFLSQMEIEKVALSESQIDIFRVRLTDVS